MTSVESALAVALVHFCDDCRFGGERALGEKRREWGLALVRGDGGGKAF